jgi:predicted lipoprotein with Yx(FWY)xxD motif
VKVNQNNAWRFGRGFAAMLVVDVIVAAGLFYVVASGGVYNFLYSSPRAASTVSSSSTTAAPSNSTSAASTNSTVSTTSSTSSVAYTISVATSPTLGKYLVDGAGFTLYYFVPDQVGNATSPPVSHCTTALNCIQVWPVFYAPTIVVPPSLNASSFTTFTRSDGTNQTAYLGHPLYLYLGDSSPGQTNGNAIDINGGYWYVVPATPGATFKS